MGEIQAEARARAVAKVTRPSMPWREVYTLDEALGVAVHRAVTENA
jgi:hypothetical protein